MIQVRVAVPTIIAGRRDELTVVVRNDGAGTCTKVRFRLALPLGLLPVGGSTLVGVDTLDAGTEQAHVLQVEARAAGEYQVRVESLSYRDARGRSHNHPDPVPVLTVWARPAAAEPVAGCGPRPVPRPVLRRKVFISYRGSDSSALADHLYGELCRALGADRVFLDRENRRLGKDFRIKLADELAASGAMLALIGPAWNPLDPATGVRPLSSPEDYVRYEIKSALAAEILLIPVLHEGARLPLAADLPEDIVKLAAMDAAVIPTSNVRHEIRDIIDALRRHLYL